MNMEVAVMAKMMKMVVVVVSNHKVSTDSEAIDLGTVSCADSGYTTGEGRRTGQRGQSIKQEMERIS